MINPRYHLDYDSLAACRLSRAPTSPKPVTGQPYSTTQTIILRGVNSGVRLLSFFRTGLHRPPALWDFRIEAYFRYSLCFSGCEIGVSISQHCIKVKQNIFRSAGFNMITMHAANQNYSSLFSDFINSKNSKTNNKFANGSQMPKVVQYRQKTRSFFPQNRERTDEK